MRSLTHWSPIVDTISLQSEMDRVFGRVIGGWPPSAEMQWIPATEVTSNAEGWKVRIALSGVDPNDVQVDLDGRVLKVAGERGLGAEAANAEHWTSEIGHGRFKRSFTVPESVAVDKVAASFENGMLELTLPVTEAEKPRRIELSNGPTKAKKVA